MYDKVAEVSTGTSRSTVCTHLPTEMMRITMEMMEEARGSTTLISTYLPTYYKCKRFETKKNVSWVTGLPGKLDVECEYVNIASRLNVYSFMYTRLCFILLSIDTLIISHAKVEKAPSFGIKVWKSDPCQRNMHVLMQ